MKKVVCVLLAAVMCLAITGCGGAGNGRPAQTNQGKSVNDVLSEKMNEGDQTKEDPPVQSRDDTESANDAINDIQVDVDLTQLSSTMVYSEVYNMMTEPDSLTKPYFVTPASSVRLNLASPSEISETTPS